MASSSSNAWAEGASIGTCVVIVVVGPSKLVKMLVAAGPNLEKVRRCILCGAVFFRNYRTENNTNNKPN